MNESPTTVELLKQIAYERRTENQIYYQVLDRKQVAI
jgi:hypothetical protein